MLSSRKGILSWLVTLLFAYLPFAGFAQSFEQVPTTVKPAATGVSGWADLNNDGWLDLVVLAKDEAGLYHLQVYYNQDSLSLELSSIVWPIENSFSGDMVPDLQFHDLDNDNQVDIFILAHTANVGPSLTILKNTDGFSFTEVQHPIVIGGKAGFTVGDFNSNGIKEILVTGVLSQNEVVSKFYSFKEGEYTQVEEGTLPASGKSKILPFDFNKDSALDFLLLSELEEGKAAAQVYLNQGDFVFQSANLDFPLQTYFDAALLDFNQDGFMDFVVSGLDLDGSAVTSLFSNLESEFTPTALNLLGGKALAILAGDLTQDGKMDLLLKVQKEASGPDSIQIFTQKEGSDGVFTQAQVSLPPLQGASFSFTDFNEDGNLDLFLLGKEQEEEKAMLWRNSSEIKNLNPGFPSRPIAYMEGSAIHFAWLPAADDHTPTASLSYALTVVKVNDYFMSDLRENRNRKLQAFGAQGLNTDVTLKNIPEGIYQFGLIAIDNSYKGSKSGNSDGDGNGRGDRLCPASFVIYDAKPIDVCFNGRVTLNPAALKGQKVEWYSASKGFFATGTSVSFLARKSEAVVAVVELPGGCSETLSFPVQVRPELDVKLPAALQVCENEKISLSIKNQPGVITWTSRNQGVLGNTATIQYQSDKADQIWVEVVNDLGCSLKESVEITVTKQILVSSAAEKTICLRQGVVIGPGNEFPESQYSFAWSPALGLNNPSVRNPTASPMESTNYLLVVTHKISGCQGDGSFKVNVRPARVLNPGQDRVICQGEVTQLGGAPTAKGPDATHTYKWSPAAGLDDPSSANPSAAPTTTTTYRLIVSSASCPADTSYVRVTVNPPPPSGKLTKYTIYAGENVMLQASGGTSYRWSPAKALNNAEGSSTQASPMETTTYRVVVTDANGCAGFADHEVTVKYMVLVPNLFSPNNDGHNDTFKIYGHGIKWMVLQVFSRTGQLLFETKDPQTAWNGIYRNNYQPSGTYVWTISGEFVDGTPIHFEGQNSGKLTLIR